MAICECHFFVDKRCSGNILQLDLLRATDCAGIVFYAQSSSWCAQWVSICNKCKSHLYYFWKHCYYFLLLLSYFSVLFWFKKSREFSNEKNRVDRRVQYQKFRNQQMFVGAMTSYLDWITQAGVMKIRNVFSFKMYQIVWLVRSDIPRKCFIKKIYVYINYKLITNVFIH